MFNASVQTVRYPKCLHFQPSKSSSSYPLEAYYRTHRERQKFKTNAFSFTCCSQQEFFFILVRPLFFDAGLSVHPLPFPPQEKKIVEGEKNRETWPSGKERFFSFLVETRHTYITPHITTEYKHHGASSERKHDQPERPDRGIRGQRPHRGESRRTRCTVEERPVFVAV